MGGSASTTKQIFGKIGQFSLAPWALAIMPAFSLLVLWMGGMKGLLVFAIASPVAYLACISCFRTCNLHRQSDSSLTLDRFLEDIKTTYARTQIGGLHSALFVIELEETDAFVQKFGQTAIADAAAMVRERLISATRNNDQIGQLSPTRFAVCLAPVNGLDLEVCIQLAGRLQAAAQEPISVDSTIACFSASIGFCQSSKAPTESGSYWLEAAEIALDAAQHRGPGTIRAFSAQMRATLRSDTALRSELEAALDLGQIKPWFQPQISTETGKITGFEALARWEHPERGMISPPDFLPLIEQAGLLERLAEVIMFHSFSALKSWDSAGLQIPQIGVNLDGTELSNPKLVEKIKWELDRFELGADRLAVEILETVVAGSADDMIAQNIKALAEIGCRIDLDDFGTGHASIAALRRFAIGRIKIDRSFIMRADRDAEQQRMVSAILSMAEQLQIETLAEGVETIGEHVILAQLGCDHVQGFGIGKPMPFEQTADWITRHNAKLAEVPQISMGQSKP